jgi:hypothetical protein
MITYIREQDSRKEEFMDNETDRKIQKRLKFLGGVWKLYDKT